MPKLKLSTIKSLRKQNMAHHNEITDRAREKGKRITLMKERIRHTRDLQKIPFFRDLLRKQIILKAGNKSYILLGVGFKEKGSFRRSTIIIDDHGRAIFLAEVIRVKENQKTVQWLPYTLVRKRRTEAGEVWDYHKLELTQKQLDEEIRPLSEAVKTNLGEINFKDIDPRKINQIKRFM
jgi:hypothetical protein